MARMAEVASVGLSGLAVASALARRGWQVRVHEPELRMAGAGIRLCENGLRSLCLIGAEDQAVRDAKQVKEWAVVDGAGGGLVRRTFTEVSLAAAVSSGADVSGALRSWEDRGRMVRQLNRAARHISAGRRS